MDTQQEPKLSVFREAHLRDYWRIVWQGRWTVLALFVLVVSGTAIWTYMQQPVYRATATVEVQPKARGVLPSPQDVSGMGAAGYGWLAEEKYHNTQVEIIKSRDVAERVVHLLNLANHPRFAGSTDIVNAFRGLILVEARRESALLTISMQGSDPHEITQWVNAVAHAYVDRNFEQASTNVEKAVATIRVQIESLSHELSSAEEQRLGTLKKTQIFDTKGQEDVIRQNLQKYNTARADAQIALQQVEDRLTQVREMRASGSDMVALSELDDDTPLQEMLRNKVQLQRDLERVRVDLRPDHPDYEKIAGELERVDADVQDRIRLVLNNLEKRRSSLSETVSYLQDQISRTEQGMLEVAKATSEYDIVKTDADTKKRVFDLINKTMNEVQLGAQLMTNNVTVLDDAVPPRTPIKPKKRMNLAIGAMLGLFMGLGLVFFMEYLDNTIRTPEDVEKYLNLSVLAVIPKMADQGLASRAIREAFQSLRTSIIFSSKNRQRKVLLITSTGPQEGKSSSVANLGRTLAAAGDRVIIIDCDMRRPTQHLHHQVERDHGLANFLSAPIDERDWSIYTKPSQPPNLHILSCGPIPPNPPELLGGERFRELLAALRARYDWVLIDSPPAASLSDATLLAGMADMLILVVQHNRTDRDLVVRTAHQLRTVNPTIAGVVLNNVDLEKTFHKDYYYAGYYYTEEDGKVKGRRRQPEEEPTARVG